MKRPFTCFLVMLTLTATHGHTRADQPSLTRLKVGDKVPTFSATNSTGKVWNLADHTGDNILVLYFFSSAFTSSATKEAIQFRDDLKELGDRKVQLVGISGDDLPTLNLFSKTHDLNFPLLSDADGNIAKQFGLLAEEGGIVTATIEGEKLTFTRNVTLPRRIFAVDTGGNIAFDRPNVETLKEIDIVFELLARDFWVNREDGKPVWRPKIDRDWKRVLTREQYRVARRGQTEIPFFNRYWNSKAKGAYRCVCCGQILFESETKFRSGTGWPSFWYPAEQNAVTYAKDKSNGQTRIEVKCSQCDAHIGHVFPDGPPPTGKRYCMNSAALLLDSNTSEKEAESNVNPRNPK